LADVAKEKKAKRIKKLEEDVQTLARMHKQLLDFVIWFFETFAENFFKDKKKAKQTVLEIQKKLRELGLV